jgi:hypothetical protein
VSQSSKRPGARDISELKARLGLKKSKPAAPAGVIPPPGAGRGAIPAPPGAQAPQPVIPSATEDPFGAMNAMAAHGAVAAAPAIVVVNDGTPVESVEKKAIGLRAAKIAGIILAPLVLGIIMGKVSAAGNSYNKTIEDAAVIRDDLKKVGKTLVDLQQTLELAKEKGAGGASFSMADKDITELTDGLAAVKLEYPTPELGYKAHLHNLSPELITDLLLVYGETLIFYKQLKEHIEQSKNALKVFEKGMAKVGNFDPFKYAGVIELPTAEEATAGKPPTFRFVQLGDPICQGDTKTSAEGCGATPPIGFGYRIDELGQWGTKKLTETSGESVLGNRLIMFDPSTKVFEQLIKGGDMSTAEVAYMQRLEAIEKRLGELIELRKNVEQRLNNKSNEGSKFTFFL